MLKNIGKRTFNDVMDDSKEISKQIKMQRLMISEEGTLKFDFMFPLQKIVMAKIVSKLWINEISQGKKIGYFNLRETADIIIAKVSQLCLPNYISQQLQDIIISFRVSIVEWIAYHDNYCFKESGFSAADLISNIVWTVRGRIDFGQTAKNILASQNSCLSDDDKYKLACTYCIEDEIPILATKVLHLNQFYLSDIAIDIHPMVYVWTAYVTGDNTQLNNPYYYDNSNRCDRHLSINEYIMVLLTDKSYIVINDVPIRYMSNKLNEDEKAKRVRALVKYVHNRDFVFSLLSNIQYELQQNVLKEYSCYVLCNILEDWWWWGEYFSATLFHVFDSMDPKSYWRVLQYINNVNMSKYEWKEDGKYMRNQFKNIFKQLWRESSAEFKYFIFQLEHQNELGYFLTKCLCWEQDIDIFELILDDLSTQNKKIILSKECGLSICASLIQNGKWDLLEIFLKDVLSSEDDIDQLKERLIKEKGSEITLHFLKKDAY